MTAATSEGRNRYREILLSETREELLKADNKASILLAASGIAASALLSAFWADQWSPSKLRHGDARLYACLAIAAGLLGIVLVAAAVKPRLRASNSVDHQQLHYFGSVHHFWPPWWPPHTRTSRGGETKKKFVEALEAASTEVNIVNRLDDQIWFLSKSCYRKYQLISMGLWSFGLVIILAFVAAMTERY